MTSAPTSGLVAHYVADDISGNDGDAVSSWSDRSGNNYTLAQATGGLQPTLQTNELNGHSVVRFDGTDDYLTRATTPAIAQPFTFIAVAKLTDITDTATNRAMVSDAGGSVLMYHKFSSTDTGQFSLFAGVSYIGTTIPDGSTWYVYDACFDQTFSHLRLNYLGHDSPAISPSTGAVAGLRVGNFSTTSPWAGDIAEVLVYNRRLDEADRIQLLQYLYERYNLAGTEPVGTSYGNAGGMGYRNGEPAVTTTATMSSGDIRSLVNASHTANILWNSGQSGREIKFDFGPDARRIIDAFRWIQTGTTAHGTWDFQGSNDNSNWTTVIASLGLGGQAEEEFTGSNSTGYRYYRLLQTSGTTGNTNTAEIHFKIRKDPHDLSCSYWHRYGAGGRKTVITITPVNVTMGGNPISGFIDGSNGVSAAHFPNSDTDAELKFDFGSAIVCNQFRLTTTGTDNSGTFKIAGSNDDSSYTDLLTGIVIGVVTGTALLDFTNTTAYRYYKLIQTSGTTDADVGLDELAFRVRDLVLPVISDVSPDVGSTLGGDEVVITGTGLINASAVTFDGTPADSFVVDNDTQITAVTPEHVGATVDIEVENPDGTDTASFTYEPPTVDSVTPDTGLTLGGDEVVIAGTRLTGVESVTFGGTEAASFVVDSDEQISAVTPLHVSGLVDVVVDNGVDSGTGEDAFTFVVPLPEITSVDPASGPIAGGTEVVITGDNFSDASSVTFGGVEALSFVVDSDEQITAVTDAHDAGLADVSVTTPGGTDTLSEAFEFIAATRGRRSLNIALTIQSTERVELNGTDAESVASALYPRTMLVQAGDTPVHVTTNGAADVSSMVVAPARPELLAIAAGEVLSLWAGAEAQVQVSEIRLSS